MLLHANSVVMLILMCLSDLSCITKSKRCTCCFCRLASKIHHRKCAHSNLPKIARLANACLSLLNSFSMLLAKEKVASFGATQTWQFGWRFHNQAKLIRKLKSASSFQEELDPASKTLLCLSGRHVEPFCGGALSAAKFSACLTAWLPVTFHILAISPRGKYTHRIGGIMGTH